MEKDAKVHIQYSAKYQGITKAWKKWQGEIKGLQRLNAVNKKLEFENEFKNWAQQNGSWGSEYQEIFHDFESVYNMYGDYIHVSDYYSEIVLRGIEIFQLASQLNSIINSIENKQEEKISESRVMMLKRLSGFYKDFNQATDEKLFTELLPILSRDVDPKFLPDDFNSVIRKYNDNDLLNKVYRNSILANSAQLEKCWRKVQESSF